MSSKSVALGKLRAQLATIREIAGDETTVAQALVLIEVALNPGEKLTHLAEKLGTDGTHALVSRTADTLGDHQGRLVRREPAGLIERRDHETDRRARTLWLTKKGERLIEKLT